MAKFNYSGKDKKGNLVKGIIDATSREDAALVLGKSGVTPYSISEEGNILSKLKNIQIFESLSLSDKVMFCEEIATLVNSGVPLAQSINIIKSQSEKGVIRKIAEELQKDIEGGRSLSGALERQDKYFSPVFVNMVAAGEASGTLDAALNQLAVQTQKDQDLASKVKGALTYPVVIVIAMIGAVIYLMIKVVPQISSLFEELDAELPLPTKILISISTFVVNYGIWVLVAFILFIIGIVQLYRKNFKFKRMIHLLTTKIPVFGPIVIKFNIARFSRTLGSLLGSGVSVLESLDIVSKSLKNVIYIEEIEKISDKVKNGGSLADPMKQSKIFPVMVSQMIGVGEEAGNLDKMLLKVADFYDRQIDNITKNLSSILEPIIMLVVGLGIGFIVISIITPIYQATSNI